MDNNEDVDSYEAVDSNHVTPRIVGVSEMCFTTNTGHECTPARARVESKREGRYHLPSGGWQVEGVGITVGDFLLLLRVQG